MTVINTNVNSLTAAASLAVNERNLSSAMERLSTGKRINSAKDDAAGQAIASRMTAQIRGLDQGVRNANDGISMIQTADGAMEEVSNMLQRMRELAVQYANDTNSTSDQTALATEYTALNSEITRINADTTWNSQTLFDTAANVFQVGANTSDSITVSVTDFSITASAITVTSVLTALDTDINAINTARSALGAGINRLTYAANNAINISTNTSASRSRVVDTDYAKVSAELARTQIIQQAATAMLAQANQGAQSVLALLK
jgi:flagellin